MRVILYDWSTINNGGLLTLEQDQGMTGDDFGHVIIKTSDNVCNCMLHLTPYTFLLSLYVSQQPTKVNYYAHFTNEKNYISGGCDLLKVTKLVWHS